MPDISKLKLPTITHVGWTVNDIKETADFYERAFGIENNKIFEHKVSGSIRVKGELMDLTGAPPSVMALINLWSFPMCLTLGHGEAPEDKILGLDHIGFMVDDVDPWVARCQEMGVELLAEVDRVDPIKGRVRTRTMVPETMGGGLVIEFLEWENIPWGNREYFVKVDKNYIRDHNLDIPVLSHIKCLVKDIKKTVDFYERVFGVAPCEIIDHTVDNVLVKGEQTKLSVRVALMNLWSVPILLMQPIEGYLTDVLEKRGEGYYSVDYMVNNLDTWTDRLRDMGVDVLAQIERDDPNKGRVRTAAMDPDKMGGLTIEFLEHEKMP